MWLKWKSKSSSVKTSANSWVGSAIRLPMTKTNSASGKLTFWAIVQPNLSFALENMYHNIRGACERKKIKKAELTHQLKETECGVPFPPCSFSLLYFVLQRMKLLPCLMSLLVLRIAGRLPIFHHGDEIPFFWMNSQQKGLALLSVVSQQQRNSKHNKLSCNTWIFPQLCHFPAWRNTSDRR